jgi:hypothetical protein
LRPEPKQKNPTDGLAIPRITAVAQDSPAWYFIRGATWFATTPATLRSDFLTPVNLTLLRLAKLNVELAAGHGGEFHCQVSRHSKAPPGSRLQTQLRQFLTMLLPEGQIKDGGYLQHTRRFCQFIAILPP